MTLLSAPAPPRQRPAPGRRYRRFCLRLLASLLSLLLLYSPVNLAVAHLLWPQPDSIFVLGGQSHRETTAARLALVHPQLHVWASSGLPPDEVRRIFDALHISLDRITLDYQAVDTVTNFTTLVRSFQEQNVHHLYLITSDYHMPRARAIATIILGSRRIAFTPVTVTTLAPAESRLRIYRDMVRSWLWLLTGWSGANLHKA